MEKKYTTLRIIATLFKILSIIVAIITTLSAFGSCGLIAGLGQETARWSSQFGRASSGLGSLGTYAAVLIFITTILMGGLLAMILYAIGDAIYIGIDIEENTRSMARYLRQQSRLPVHATSVALEPQLDLTQNATSFSEAPLNNYCPQCGGEVDASYKNCPHCNYDLS